MKKAVILYLLLINLTSSEEHACEESAELFSNIEERFVTTNYEEHRHTSDSGLEAKWYSTVFEGIQFILADNTIEPNMDTFSCGTHDQLYLKDAHPDVRFLTSEPVETIVRSRNADGEIGVSIRKCDGEVQYYLTPTSSIDYSGYCFVPESDISSGNFCNETVTVEVYEVRSELQFTHGVPGQQDVMPYILFHCDFDTTTSAHYYIVAWFIDGTMFARFGPSDNIDDFVLHEDMLLLELNGEPVHGKTLKCGVIGLQMEDTYNDTSCMSYSNNIVLAAEVLTPTVQIYKNSISSVQVRFNLPVGCGYAGVGYAGQSGVCDYSLKMYMEDEWSCSTGGIANIVSHPRSNTFCTEPLTTLSNTDAWNGSAGIVHTMDIATIDKNYDDRKVFYLALQFDDSIAHKLWKNYTFPSIKVVVSDVTFYKNKICYSHIDPHMRSCDRLYYEHHDTGYYMMYYNKKYKIEVQEQLKPCSGSSRVRCACGVAIRAGQDVFMINRCGAINYMQFPMCGDGGILDVVKVNSRKYRIYTPVGTVIEVYMYRYLLNIDIIMSPKDEGNIEGLCGKFDNDITNDLQHSDGSFTTIENNWRQDPKEFSRSWQVSSDMNLFLQPERQLESWTDSNQIYCRCNNPGMAQSESLCAATHSIGCKDSRSITEKKCSNNSRKRRSIKKHGSKELRRLFSLMSMDRLDRQKREINTGNISAENASDICSALKQTLAMTNFSNFTAEEDMDAVTFQCETDVMELNDPSMVDIHTEALNDIVKNMMELTPSYTENNTEEVEYFLSNSCTNNCSGNGNCSTDGECVCNDDYRGADCSTNIADILVIDDIEGGGVCDTSQEGECQCFYIRTDNLFDGFYCKMSLYQVDRHGETTHVSNTSEFGEYQDIFTGICCISINQNDSQTTSFALKYTFAISNDGVHHSTDKETYIYDSTCQVVQTSINSVTVMMLKVGFCFLEGTCIEDGQNSSVECHGCRAEVDPYAWTNVCESNKPDSSVRKEDGGLEETQRIAIGLVTTVLIIVVMVCVIIVWQCLKKRPNVEPASSPTNGVSGEPNRTTAIPNYLWTLHSTPSNAFQQQERIMFNERSYTFQGPHLPDGEHENILQRDLISRQSKEGGASLIDLEFDSNNTTVLSCDVSDRFEQ